MTQAEKPGVRRASAAQRCGRAQDLRLEIVPGTMGELEDCGFALHLTVTRVNLRFPTFKR